VFSNDDENPIQRAILGSLQMVALGLCAMIVYEMCVASALGIPQRMCVDLQTQPAGPQ
jgi:xanthine/uracil permease